MPPNDRDTTEERPGRQRDREAERFDYSYWANAGLRDVLSQVTTEQFTQPVAGSYGSIRTTMVHMLSAEWGWLERCGGAARGPALDAQDYPTGHCAIRPVAPTRV